MCTGQIDFPFPVHCGSSLMIANKRNKNYTVLAYFPPISNQLQTKTFEEMTDYLENTDVTIAGRRPPSPLSKKPRAAAVMC